MYRVVEEKTGYYASAALALELLRRERWKNVIFAAALAGRQHTLLEIVDARLVPQRRFLTTNGLGEIEARLASGGTSTLVRLYL
jgi:hypothetical protein